MPVYPGAFGPTPEPAEIIPYTLKSTYEPGIFTNPSTVNQKVNFFD